jgi:hypothetical protein
MNVAKVDQDVAYVLVVLQAFVPNISSVFLDVCCKCIYLVVVYVSHICLQMFYLDIAHVLLMVFRCFYKCFRCMF